MNIVKRTFFVFFVMELLYSPITMAREKININLGWKYQSGSIEQAQDVHFNDKDWQVVNLPHDAQVVDPFVKKGNGASNRNGYPSKIVLCHIRCCFNYFAKIQRKNEYTNKLELKIVLELLFFYAILELYSKFA